MPLYMDIHKNLEGVTEDELTRAHGRDVDIQDQYGVRYLRWWLNEQLGTAFCLVEAPSTEAAAEVHRNSHGLLPEDIIEVSPGSVEAFLANESESYHGTRLPPDEGGDLDPAFRTILFTDMVDSTALNQHLGDDEYFRVLRTHDGLIRDTLSEYRGREVKHTGDGIMASFVSAGRAVECSIDIQRRFFQHNESGDHQSVRIRIGLSAGEPVEASNDLFGAAVSLAARACSRAESEQILAASVVRDLCIGKTIPFKTAGRVRLKGFDQPVQLCEVLWR